MQNLTPKHLKDLCNSTLSNETIVEYSISSLSETEVRARLGRQDIEGGGILFPFPDSRLFRVRLDKPLPDAKGKPKQKYLNPTGEELDLYMTLPAREKLQDIGTPFYFIEGEKKSLSCAQLGYAAIGLCGVYGWRSKRSEGKIVPRLSELILKDRPCYILFDADKNDNPQVKQAEYDFALYLRKRGAKVGIINLPYYGKNILRGVDNQIKDFIDKGNLDDLKKDYLENPQSYEEYIALAKQEKEDSPYTGVWSAEKLVELYGSDIRWCQDIKKWFAWNGKYWKEDPGALAVERMAKRLTKEMLKSKDKDIKRHGKVSQSKQRLEEMVELAKSEEGVEIPPNEFNIDGYLLNCINGTINLRTGGLLPHNKEHYITRMIKVAYDIKAQCPRWHTFLDEIFGGNQNIISFLQKVAGYCLTDSTEEHCIFILYGTGRNGKNTFLDTLRMLLGEYATVTGAETLMTKRDADGGAPSEHVASLWGKRLAMASESDDKNVISEATIKRVSADRTVRCRFLHANSFEYCPTYKIFLVTNYKPAIHGTDEGIWSKIRLIPFEKFIPPEKRIMGYDKILLREEAAGILRWCVEGCLLWQKEGLGMVKEVEEATSRYREEEDFIGNFLKEIPVLGEFLEVSTLELYSHFKKYSESNGRHYPSQQKFVKYLESRGFKKSQRTFGSEKGRMFWKGIGLPSSTGENTEAYPDNFPPIQDEQ